MRIYSAAAAAAAALVLTVCTPAGAQTPSTAPAVIKLGCYATPSVANPRHNTVTTIRISEVAHGKVRVVARFRSGAVAKVVPGSAAGTAAAAFNVGSADRGRRVPVTVSAGTGSLRWTCTTSFVPR